MKKPVLATLGVAAACAACCAIPLAIPLLAGLSVGGLVMLEASYLLIGLGMALALMVGVALWLRRRRKRACEVSAEGAACRTEGTEKACAC